MWKIGNVTIENQVVMAPMAGITNMAYRKLVRQFGAGAVVSEMISDKAICYGNKKTIDMMVIDKDEHPMGLQLFGGEPETMAKAARFMQDNTDCDFIDINMGCPVNKVLKSHAGSYLMTEPELAYDILTAVVNAVDLPVTVKMRIGFDRQHINVVEMAQLAEQAGVSAIAVHGRTRSQFYEGEADWSWIKKVKDAVSVAVMGNGDIKSPEDAKRMLDETGCDAVMIGRAALGNPWLIKRTVDYLATGVLEDEPTYHDKIQQCLVHAQSLIDLDGEKGAMAQMRGQAPWYIKGLPGSAKVKNKLTQMTSYSGMQDILQAFETELDNRM